MVSSFPVLAVVSSGSLLMGANVSRPSSCSCSTGSWLLHIDAMSDASSLVEFSEDDLLNSMGRLPPPDHLDHWRWERLRRRYPRISSCRHQVGCWALPEDQRSWKALQQYIDCHSRRWRWWWYRTQFHPKKYCIICESSITERTNRIILFSKPDWLLLLLWGSAK